MANGGGAVTVLFELVLIGLVPFLAEPTGAPQVLLESDEGVYLLPEIRAAVDRAELPLWPDRLLPSRRPPILSDFWGRQNADYKAAKHRWTMAQPPQRRYRDEEYEP